MKKLWHIYILLLFFGSLLFFCDSDTGLEPTQSGFSGTVRFKNVWPADTDQVIVVAATKFPPTDITEIVLGDPLPLNVDSVNFTIYSPPAEFAAVGVVWKQIDQPYDVTNIIGIHFTSDDQFSPAPIRIRDRNHMVNSINIDADLSKAKHFVESNVRGLITVKGEWPASAESILIFASKPLLPTGLLDISFGLPIAAGFDSTNYTINIQPGTYRLFGALLLESGSPIGVESIKGIYYKNEGDIFPGTVKVPTDTSQVKNINIQIDFGSNLFSVSKNITLN